VALVAEAQAQEKGVNFLQQEAGISAYVKVEQAIDLAQVKGAFKSVETVSDEYIIGEVALADLLESAHPHVYVNKDGWIVAYYSKDEPVSKIVRWVGGGIIWTTLEDAIRMIIYDVLKLPYKEGSAKYYDFKYPSANRIMMVIEVIDERQNQDVFHFTIPKRLRLFEAAWSYYFSRWGDSELWLDNMQVKFMEHHHNDPGVEYDDLTAKLRVDFRHTVTMKGKSGEGAAIVLIYQV
jgi:hypothetical protein